MAMNSLSVLGGNFATKGELDLAGGLVHINTTTFSAVSSVSLDNVFTSDYKNYSILMFGTSSAGFGGDIRLRAGGSDATGSNYSRINLDVSSGSVTASGSTTTSWTSPFLGNSTAMLMDAILIRPAEATSTFIQVRSSRNDYLIISGGAHTVASAYDGFSLLAPGAITLTGTISVYGYSNGA